MVATIVSTISLGLMFRNLLSLKNNGFYSREAKEMRPSTRLRQNYYAYWYIFWRETLIVDKLGYKSFNRAVRCIYWLIILNKIEWILIQYETMPPAHYRALALGG